MIRQNQSNHTFVVNWVTQFKSGSTKRRIPLADVSILCANFAIAKTFRMSVSTNFLAISQN
jgi:hypothetical protein